MQTHLALDFDGVICDSVDECHLSALNGWRLLDGQRQLLTDFKALDPSAVERFRQLRHLAHSAPEFWALIHFTYHEQGAVDRARFESKMQAEAAAAAAFEPLFFKARGQLRSADPGRWLGLHRMYPQFQSGWERIKGRLPVFIITTKDRESIRYFNRVWALGIPDSHLWTKERGTDKAQALLSLARQADYPPQSFIFVDDNLDHVQRVAATGARSFLARWGYIDPQALPGPADDGIGALDQLSDLLPIIP